MSGFFCIGGRLFSQGHCDICLHQQFSFESLGRFYVMLQNQRVVIGNNHSEVLIVVRVEEGLLRSHTRRYSFKSKQSLLHQLLDFSQEKLPRDRQSHTCGYWLPLPAGSTLCWYNTSGALLEGNSLC